MEHTRISRCLVVWRLSIELGGSRRRSGSGSESQSEEAQGEAGRLVALARSPARQPLFASLQIFDFREKPDLTLVVDVVA